MKRTTFDRDSCPVARAVGVVGDWWSLLIVRDALLGRRRFGEFQESLGVAKNILTDRLRKLVEAGVMETIPATDGSVYKEYILTDRGRKLLPVIVALGQWAEGDGVGIKLVDAKRSQPVRLEFRSENGRRVNLEDVQMVADE